MKLADKGLVLNDSAFASAIGMHPVEFKNSLKESKYTGWLDEFSQLMVNVNVISQGGNDNGRPRLSDTEISESGEMNRNQ